MEKNSKFLFTSSFQKTKNTLSLKTIFVCLQQKDKKMLFVQGNIFKRAQTASLSKRNDKRVLPHTLSTSLPQNVSTTSGFKKEKDESGTVEYTF